MNDCVFKFSDHDEAKKFATFVAEEEELWCKVEGNDVVVQSIFESTAEYLYDIVEKKKF